MIVLATCRGQTANDSRKNNRGCSVRVKHANEKKAATSQFYETSGLRVTDLTRKHHLHKKYKKFISEVKTRRRNSITKHNMLKSDSGAKHKKCKHVTNGNHVLSHPIK